MKKHNNSFLDQIELLLNIVEFGCECAQVLIVDDIDMNRYVIKEILRSKFGLAVEEATNGKESLKMIKEKSFSECCSKYKLIFMDYEMPILNGIEASKKIRSYEKEGRIESGNIIIAYTAYIDEESTC